MRLELIWVQIYSFCYSNECYLPSDLQARGLWNGALCRYSKGRSSYTHLFLYLTLWYPPLCTPSTLPVLSEWMYSTSCSSICFRPPMKRSIIMCKMHNCYARSSAWTSQKMYYIYQSNAQLYLCVYVRCLRSLIEQILGQYPLRPLGL